MSKIDSLVFDKDKGTFALTATYDQVNATVTSQADNLHNPLKLCGRTNWRHGTRQSVSGQDCNGVKMPKIGDKATSTWSIVMDSTQQPITNPTWGPTYVMIKQAAAAAAPSN